MTLRLAFSGFLYALGQGCRTHFGVRAGLDERRLDEGRTSRGSDGMHTRAHVRSVFLPVLLATAIASSIAVYHFTNCVHY